MGIETKRMAVNYKGKLSSLLFIELINLLFIILTLGLYSLWATGRMKKYVCRHFEIDGRPLKYSGDVLINLKRYFIMIACFVNSKFEIEQCSLLVNNICIGDQPLSFLPYEGLKNKTKLLMILCWINVALITLAVLVPPVAALIVLIAIFMVSNLIGAHRIHLILRGLCWNDYRIKNDLTVTQIFKLKSQNWLLRWLLFFFPTGGLNLHRGAKLIAKHCYLEKEAPIQSSS